MGKNIFKANKSCQKYENYSNLDFTFVCVFMLEHIDLQAETYF